MDSFGLKNSPNKDNDVDNQRLISMTLNDVSYKIK